MKKWCLLAMALLLCCLTAAACAETEAEAERLPIPEWTEDLWPAPRPLDGEEAAIAYAKEIFSSPLLQIDLTGAEWTAEWTDNETYTAYYVQHRSSIQVTGTLPDGRELVLNAYADNGGIRTIVGPDAEDYYGYNDFEAFDPDDPWREELWQFALTLLETMEPGLTSQFISMKDDGDLVVDGVRLIQLEFQIDQDYSRPFRLQVFPELRLLETYTGLG